MTEPFDWAGLWRETADVFKKHGENIAATTLDDMDQAAAAYLRERIEAAFVPVEEWERLRCDNAALEGIYRARCSQLEEERALATRFITNHTQATARAEAAEARVKVLEAQIDERTPYTPEEVETMQRALERGWDMPSDPPGKREMLRLATEDLSVRAALGGEHDK